MPAPSSPATQRGRSAPAAGEPTPGNRLRLIAAGVLLVAAVVAAVFWYSGGSTGSTGAPPIPTPVQAAHGHDLVVGRPGAPHRVVIVESSHGTASRALELATRDYLREFAGRGTVQVTYRLLDGSVASLAAHDRLYDAGAPVTTDPRLTTTSVPRVRLDGTPVTGTVTSVADLVEGRLAEK